MINAYIFSQIIKMWYDGISLSNIAHIFNLKVENVCAMMRREGYIS